MAFVLQKFVASFVIVDQFGRKVNRRYDLNTTDPNAAFNSMNSIRDRMGLLMNAKIMTHTLERIHVDDAFTLPAVADNRVNAVISALLAGQGSSRAKLSVPSPSAGVFQGTTGEARDLVNFENSGVDTFLKAFGTGVWGTAMAKVSDGQLITLEDLKGWRSHRKT